MEEFVPLVALQLAISGVGLEGDKLGRLIKAVQSQLDPALVAPISKAPGCSSDNPMLVFEFSEEQRSGIRGDVAVLETAAHPTASKALEVAPIRCTVCGYRASGSIGL